MEDNEIVDLYLARDECAIAATEEKYGNYCHTIAFNILHNNEDAAECANDTYLGAWNSIPPQRPNPLSTYIGRIARNLALNRYKQYTTKKRGAGQTAIVLSELEDCISTGLTAEQEAEDKVITSAINCFLYAQPRFKRNVFIRRYWHLWSIRNIADTYAMSDSKIASMLFRMRIELKKHLEKEGITL